MKYDLFLSDFDGTLGCSPDYIDKSTVEAIKEYEKKGGTFAIVTGRSFASIRGICLKHGLKGKIVAFQGATIADIESGEILMQEGLSCKLAIDIVKRLKKDGVISVVWIDDVLYYADMCYYVSVFVADNGVRCERVKDVEEVIKKLGKTVNKVCGFADTADVTEYLNLYSKAFGAEVVVNSGAKHLIEFINAKYDKGFAVKRLAEELKIPFEKVIAIGDSTNDIPLMNELWHGVAVGDGAEELKKCAKEITLPFKENPVKNLLEKYCL